MMTFAQRASGFASASSGSFLKAMLLGLFALSLAIRPAMALTESEKIVDKSKITVETFLSDPEMTDFKKFLGKAKGVLIFPQLLKGGFILGAEGGTGVLLVKGSDGTWSPPAFFTLAAGSIGLQIGGQVSQATFTIMNEKAVNAILKNKFKFGADVSVAVGPVGAGIGASSTTNLNADIYTFSKVVGLFGGGALDGAGLISRESLDEAFYGLKVPAKDIVLHRKVFNTYADPLRNALPR